MMPTETLPFVPLSRPAIGEAEIEAATRVLRSGWLTTGPEAQAFEREFGAYVGASCALAVNSATGGLHLALEALGVGPGTRVVCPSLTFTATAEVARYLGAEVRFADVGRDSLLVDPESIALRVSEAEREGVRVAAILPVHLAGEVCAMGSIGAVAASCGAAVVEDAAHAFPVPTPDGYAGTIGTIGVYSFYATKTITTGEGGMVCTDDASLARRMAVMRLHGIDRDAWRRHHGADESWRYEVVAPGFKYNLTDIAAAIGRVQLSRAAELLAARTAQAARYRSAFEGLARAGVVRLPRDSSTHAWHLFVIRVSPEIGGGRDGLARFMRARSVGSSVHYAPLHRMPYWRDTVPPVALPETERRSTEILSLPLFAGLTAAEQDRVIDAVLGWAREAGGG